MTILKILFRPLSNEQKVTIYTSLIAGLVGLFGVLMGVMLNERVVMKQSLIQQQVTIIQKRMDLISHFSKLINSKPRAEELANVMSIYAEIISSSKTQDKSTVFQVLPYSGEFVNLQADYASTIQIIAWSFCEKTRQAVRDLPREVSWYQIDRESHLKVLNMMSDEIYCFTSADKEVKIK